MAVLAISAICVPSAQALVAYCPTKGELHVWEPCVFDIGEFKGNIVRDKITTEGTTQGYMLVRRQDKTRDNSVDQCTRAEWDGFAVNAGVLLMDTHGNQGWVAAAYSTDASVLDDWADADNDGNPDPFMSVEESPTQGEYFVMVTYGFFENDWFDLGSNRAIVFVASCGSADGGENSIMNNIGGRVVFAYHGESNTAQHSADADRLFGMMNGELASGQNRRSDDAFNAGGYSNGFRMGDDPTTLCPGVFYVSPADGSHVGASGYAKIVFDSFCEDEVPVGQALTIQVSGSCDIRELQWIHAEQSEDPAQNCREIRFIYEGPACNPNFTITVTAHGDKIKAKDGTQFLDGNNVAPNGDDRVWSFSCP